MKTLLVFAPEQRHIPRAEQQRETTDISPRVSLLEETLGADVIDGSFLDRLQSRSRLLRILAKIIPVSVFMALLVYGRRKRYAAVVSWDDRFALIYAFLLRLTGSRARHIAILSWVAPLKKALVLRLVQKGMDGLILWSQTQRDLLVELFHISPERVVVIPYFVDQCFWHPLPEVPEGICAVGDSRRDYATLIEAMRGLAFPCAIATHVQQSSRGHCSVDWEMTRQSLARVPDLPDNVAIDAFSVSDLRVLYARSHFVVIPLFPGWRDSGITVVTQAMAMGKAIICSRIQGQYEFLEDGVTGIFVPPDDPQALRRAIVYLWEHPEVARRLGAEGRRRAESIFRLETFVSNVCQIVDHVVANKGVLEKEKAMGSFQVRPENLVTWPHPFTTDQPPRCG